jgi:hypothetical protein
MGQIPCWQGKKQGISPIRPFFAKIRLENTCETSMLRENSLRGEQGIISRAQGIDSHLAQEQGIWREIDPCAPTYQTAATCSRAGRTPREADEQVSAINFALVAPSNIRGRGELGLYLRFSAPSSPS